jgi:hypothetical protein
MSYRLNKTNGELLVELVDGQIDTTSTDITLVGRNYKGFGEFLNENYIKMLENFAKTSAPGNPLVGQLWYDTAEERLKLYNGETFRSAGGPVVSNVRPNLVTGDLWIDSELNQLWFFDGTDVVLVGPKYNAQQQQTETVAESIIDRNGQEQTVMFLYIGGQLAGIYSNTTFVPLANIPGYPLNPDDLSTPRKQIVRQGFNPVSDNFWWRGTSSQTRALVAVDDNDNIIKEYTEANFMKTDANTSTTGTIKIQNTQGGGLTIGVGTTEFVAFKIVNEITTIETQRSDKDFRIRTRRGAAFDTALYIDASTQRIGLWNAAPTVSLDVTGDGRFTGDLEIEGNLTVQGDTTTVNVATIQVEDKNIELSMTDGAAAGDDSVADGGGITLSSTDGNKIIYWPANTGNWTSNQDFDLVSGKVYKINDVVKLSADRLHDTVLYAEGLVSVGTLVDLNTENFQFRDSAMTVTTSPLSINSTGTITINNKNITGVIAPVNPLDVANKQYVDEQIDSEPVVLSLDVTGYSNPSNTFDGGADGPYNDVLGILEYLYPAAEKENGTVARVFATTYSSAVVSNIGIQTVTQKSYVSAWIDPEDSTTPQYESVLADVNFDTASGQVNITPSRGKIEFEVSGGSWQWVRTIAA